MSDTQTQTPSPRKDMPTGVAVSLMLLVLAFTVPMLYFAAAPKLELYRHGQVTEGTVLEVEQKEYHRKSSTYTAYEHTIKYAGYKKPFVKKHAYNKGAKVAIYYSTEDPDTAVFKEEGLPYTSWIDILLDPIVLLLVVVNALFLAAFLFIAKLGMDEARAKESV
jgi:hypothetical protein